MSDNCANKIIVIRGGGDIATGVVQKFHRAGFNVLILETQTPTAIRRSVALCEAVYDRVKTVEDMKCSIIANPNEAGKYWQERIIPLLIDPNGSSIKTIKPAAVIDAIIAKRNTGTKMNMAKITIALGPGFTAGKDVHAVIETKRGHNLGRLILQGQAEPDTGIPGEIMGESTNRVIYTPEAGTIKHIKSIGSNVKQGEVLFTIENNKSNSKNSTLEVKAPLTGLLRGLIREGITVGKRVKAADIDPRPGIDYLTISDKARCIGGAALEVYFSLANTGNDCKQQENCNNEVSCINE